MQNVRRACLAQLWLQPLMPDLAETQAATAHLQDGNERVEAVEDEGILLSRGFVWISVELHETHFRGLRSRNNLNPAVCPKNVIKGSTSQTCVNHAEMFLSRPRQAEIQSETVRVKQHEIFGSQL
jgi:hypothetical protein